MNWRKLGLGVFLVWMKIVDDIVVVNFFSIVSEVGSVCDL
jgi:hypothetical protein